MARTMEDEVQRRRASGWRITEDLPGHTVMEKGEKIRHGSHIFLTVITLGLWGTIYGLHLIFGGLKRVRITANREGNAVVRRI